MRSVSIAPTRLERWLDGFVERHGAVGLGINGTSAELTAEDGAIAEIRIPFPPLLELTVRGLIAHASRERTVGALLTRRGGVAVGVFQGRRLLTSKIETAYVQGRTKAGGWSQQRYARRRANQARKLGETAADLLATYVLPAVDTLDAVATGGDRASVEEVLGDVRLARLRDLALPRTYPVADPRLAVLQSFPDQFLAVEIQLNELA